MSSSPAKGCASGVRRTLDLRSRPRRKGNEGLIGLGPCYKGWNWKRGGSFWRATHVGRILIKQKICGDHSEKYHREVCTIGEESGRVHGSSSFIPVITQVIQVNYTLAQYIYNPQMLYVPFSVTSLLVVATRDCSPKRTESFILPPPPQTRLLLMFPTGELRKKWLTHLGFRSAFHKWLQKSRDKTWGLVREVKGKMCY